MRERVTIRGMGDERVDDYYDVQGWGWGRGELSPLAIAAGLAGCQVRRSYNLYTHTHTLTSPV